MDEELLLILSLVAIEMARWGERQPKSIGEILVFGVQKIQQDRLELLARFEKAVEQVRLEGKNTLVH